MTRTRIKFCGFTRADDVDAAVALGVDLIGLNLARGPRRIELDHAVTLARRVPPGCGVVALFVDASEGTILHAASRLRAAAVQLHGDEPPELGERLRARIPVIKAARIAVRDDLERLRGFPAEVFLLDAAVAGSHGGTGARWDLELLRGVDLGVPVMLAGGLTPETVAEALALRPWAVDTASGIESAPGCKDAARMAAFVARVNRELAQPPDRRDA